MLYFLSVLISSKMCGDGDLFCRHKEKWKSREEEKSPLKSKLQNYTAWGREEGEQGGSSINSDANSTVHLIGSRNTQSSDMSGTIHERILD